MIDLTQLPHQFTGPSAWIGKDLEKAPEKWLYQLTAEDIAGS